MQSNRNYDSPSKVDIRKLTYNLNDGIGHRARIGLIALPDDQNIEYELRMIFNLPGVACFVNRLPCAAAITADSLRAMEGEITRSAGLILPHLSVDVMAFGCTSGSLLIGPATVHARIKAAHPDALCTTPIEAAANALSALEARRIALITPYQDEINLKLAAFLRETVCEVAILGSWNEPIDARVGRIAPDAIRKAALDSGSSRSVDTVFISCTNLRALKLINELESKLGKPVITSNQVLGWHCLQLAGIKPDFPLFGRLLSLNS